MSEHEDCRKCRDWKGCPGKEWYSYQDIRWCHQQVFWLLEREDKLSEGLWPTPDATADPGVRGRNTSTEASFTKAVLIIAELRERLKTTGWRGRLLVEQCKNRETIDYLDGDVKPALDYVSGWRRKETPFNVWQAKKRYRKYTQEPPKPLVGARN